MGNMASGSGGSGGGGNGRRRNQSRNPNTSSILPPPQQPLEVPPSNRYIFAATIPYAQYPNPGPPQYYHYVGYYPPPPTPYAHSVVQLPAPLDHHHRGGGDQAGYQQGWRNRYSSVPSPRAPVVEHQKAVTIRNDVNLKKETLVIEEDEENPGRYLVAFRFDATAAGSITVLFFAQEGFECKLTPTKETFLPPVTVSFKNGLGQQFKQPPGTGIDISMFKEFELIKEGETEIYPLAIRAEASPVDQEGSAENNNMVAPNSQITQAVFEKKENGEYRVRVVKQILWLNGTRYELQEIYGVGNFDGNDPGKECVVCLSELRDTAVLPCRHMCLCRECAEVLRYRTNRCPVCRQPVDRLLEMKVNNGGEDDLLSPCCQAGKKRGGTTSAMAEPELQNRVAK
ncbi:probable E3 ubiquitin-protein ligase LUL2 [Phalaenopsis equestris]|uniref:probable E3 ubiquitin-protein ligase LUL2 n=1 Tax=Phalaenopsis equestris TaxID=78828 RepID=UPI0009E4FDAA|nr:probable E3 ubiquitin-protein ligase LUL2 [Phalaenopsis equestris]